MLNGGDGTDTADYSDNTDDVEVDLSAATVRATEGGTLTDTLTSIENVTGGSGNDTLTGTDSLTVGNVLDGGAGDDILAGGLGADTLIGGADSGAGDTADLYRRHRCGNRGPVRGLTPGGDFR